MNQKELLHKIDRVNAQLRIVVEYEDNPIVNSINDELASIVEEFRNSISENKPKNFNISFAPHIDAEKLLKDSQRELRKLGVDV